MNDRQQFSPIFWGNIAWRSFFLAGLWAYLGEIWCKMMNFTSHFHNRIIKCMLSRVEEVEECGHFPRSCYTAFEANLGTESQFQDFARGAAGLGIYKHWCMRLSEIHSFIQSIRGSWTPEICLNQAWNLKSTFQVLPPYTVQWWPRWIRFQVSPRKGLPISYPRCEQWTSSCRVLEHLSRYAQILWI